MILSSIIILKKKEKLKLWFYKRLFIKSFKPMLMEFTTENGELDFKLIQT